MTLTVERRVAAASLPTPVVERPTTPACPLWCMQDLDWHAYDRASHDGPTVVIPTDCQPCTRHDENPASSRSGDVWLSLERTDEDGVAGPVRVSLLAGGGLSADTHLSFDRAEELADELRRLVAIARGAKRAAEIRVGDVIVWDGVDHTVVITLGDSEYCEGPDHEPDACPGSVAFETDVSGDGNWMGRRFGLDELVPVRFPDEQGGR